MASAADSNLKLGLLQDADATPQDELRSLFAAVAATNGGTFEVTLTSAQILALNATPVSLLDAPGVGKAWLINRVTAYKPAGTAYAGVATGEDLALKYTNAAGAIAAQIETTGFIDQATAQVRSVKGIDTDITPVDNAAIVAHMLTGEVITGDTVIKLRIDARVIDTAW